MNLAHVPHKIKSLLSFGHIKPAKNQLFKQNSNNLASVKSKLRSYLQLLQSICSLDSSQFQAAGGY